MNAPRELLEACWMLADQETMLDVAATIAATQPEIVPTLTKHTEGTPGLSLHWEARQLEMKKAS